MQIVLEGIKNRPALSDPLICSGETFGHYYSDSMIVVSAGQHDFDFFVRNFSHRNDRKSVSFGLLGPSELLNRFLQLCPVRPTVTDP